MEGYVERPIDIGNGKMGTAYVKESLISKFDRDPAYMTFRTYIAHKIVDENGNVIKDVIKDMQE